jgi:hypothetical protein
MPKLIVIAMVLSVGVGATEQASDFMDSGVTLSGRSTFERELKKGTSLFTIRVENDLLLIRVLDEYAFGRDHKNSISSQWANVLATGESSRFRLADRSPGLEPGTLIDDHSLEHIAMCVPSGKGPALASRDERAATFMLRCVAFKEQEQVKRDGVLVFEIDLVVSTRNESTLDRFLNRRRDVLYVRLE